MNGNTFRTLEFESIRALVLSHTGSEAGKDRVRALAPRTEAGAVRAALGRTSEAVLLLRTIGRQPYHDLPEVSPLLAAARVQGLHLEPRDLTDVASFIEGAIEIGRRVARAEGAPQIARLASGVADATDVSREIRRAVLPSGEVADDASPRLAEVRRALTRLKAQLTSVMESYLRGKDADRVLQDKLITTRNDRYVLLLKAEHRGQVPGIIHGASGSGASLFVEPLPAVELNNDIVSLGDEERREVIRILEMLTARVGERADDLQRAVEILGEMDAAQAMAAAAKDMDAICPEIAPTTDRLELLDARHPLLMSSVTERLGTARRSTREPVPVTIRITAPHTALVISGPNTGGKTVALKTLGLLSLMAQSGLHVPVGPGSVMPVFKRVFADIGDEQSIAANLSTFSAHLKSIVDMTRDLALPALVLLDEVGAGTDPTEGGALGVAIVEHFRARGATVVATTHHGLMKAYAQSTPGVGCASFGYDPRTYEPTYRLELGAAGRSLALEMADRLGLPPEVVSDARARMDERERQAEALLKTLEDQRAELAEDERRIDAARGQMNEERARLREEERELERKKKAELEAFRRDLQKRGEEAARQAADAVQRAVRKLEENRRASMQSAARARTEALAGIRAASEEAVRGVEAAEPEAEAAPALPLAVGGRARIKALNVVGEVLGWTGDQVELGVAGKRMRVPRGELIPMEGSAKRAVNVNPKAVHVNVSRPSNAAGVLEINVVGLTVDEALPRVDKALDQATIAERKQVRVIHGFGTGRLRKAVAEMLEGHPQVAAVHVGAEGRGGVTVVDLKE
ncbi:MAG TPA: Smr/MutS family protein [Vicinamibacteria bacterium]|nr:Smr/MutS family protein [Vicinamibacteria bacterium]